MSDDPFVRIFEEDPVVQEIMARVEARARAEAEVKVERARAEAEQARIEAVRAKAAVAVYTEAETEALRSTVVVLVEALYPELSRVARESVPRLHDPLELSRLIKQVASAPDKKTAAWVLEMFAA
ncbi:MAG TPA: hypothetical protein VNE61_12415 [Ktedonobacteraceae bacterium]|nr:hypothetical protein [Ktedonobacteraceae bacterium]